jgi:hypothetical protein
MSANCEKQCPLCKHIAQVDETFADGDYCVCPSCAFILVCGPDGQLHKPTAPQWSEVLADPLFFFRNQTDAARHHADET